MEHREVPRTAEADAPGSRRFTRFVASPAARRLALPRVGVAALAGVVSVGLVVVLGWSALRTVGRWVDRQPPYQIPFNAITLDPAPPPWFHGGAPAFLERVRESAQVSSDWVPVLDRDLGALRLDFLKYGLVKGVRRVRRFPPDSRHPARIVVSLDYRNPVAAARFPKEPGRPEVVLDEEAVILPAREIEMQTRRALVTIFKLDPPYAPRVGETYKVRSPTDEIGLPNDRALAAARMAAFLKSVSATENDRALSPELIHIRKLGFYFYIGFPRKVWVLWGKEAPSADLAGREAAEAKWKLLREWIQAHKGTAIYPDYLVFSAHGIEVRPGKAGSWDDD